MRLASLNVENLFERPRAMNGKTWAEGRQLLTLCAKVNTLLQKSVYSATDREAIMQ